MTDENPTTHDLQPVLDAEGEVFGFVVRTPGYRRHKGHIQVIYRHHIQFPALQEQFMAQVQAKLDSGAPIG